MTTASRTATAGMLLKLARVAAICILAAPLATAAQPAAKTPRLGFLSTFSSADTKVWHQAFREGLHDLGWEQGRNITFEYRYAEGRIDRLPVLAADLVGLKVDLIFADTTSPALAAKKATRTIPIVMAAASDAVGSGLVATLAQPGGNVTGLDQIAPELVGKRLELLKEIVPRVSSLAVFWNPQNKTSRQNWNELQTPARQLGVALHSVEVRSADELDRAFAAATRARADALAVLPEPIFVGNLQRIVDFAAKNRLPSIFHLREYAEAGGLVAYGPDRADLFRRAAVYVDKILRGVKPADLPIQQPTKFELVINTRTANALALTIPSSLLLRADQIIE